MLKSESRETVLLRDYADNQYRKQGKGIVEYNFDTQEAKYLKAQQFQATPNTHKEKELLSKYNPKKEFVLKTNGSIDPTLLIVQNDKGLASFMCFNKEVT